MAESLELSGWGFFGTLTLKAVLPDRLFLIPVQQPPICLVHRRSDEPASVCSVTTISIGLLSVLPCHRCDTRVQPNLELMYQGPFEAYLQAWRSCHRRRSLHLSAWRPLFRPGLRYLDDSRTAAFSRLVHLPPQIAQREQHGGLPVPVLPALVAPWISLRHAGWRCLRLSECSL